MEHIKLSIDPADFDAAVHAPNALSEGGDLAFLLKPAATVTGRPGICITFTVRLPNGTIARAQTVTTWALLQQAVIGIHMLLSSKGECQ